VRGQGRADPWEAQAGDWLTFLADSQRTSNTRFPLPAKLRELWRGRIAPASIPGFFQQDRHRDEYWNGPLTAPVVAGNTLVVGLSDAQAVSAIDAESGKVRWQTPVGGPIDTPPTIHRGLCIVGSQDGWVHALSLADGKPVWQFLAAPTYRPAMLHGRLASAFPVPGSVCILNDTVFVSSGCHSYLGGVYVWCLDPLTGRVRNKAVIAGAETPTQETMVFNDVFSASLDLKEAWIFRYFRVGLDGQPITVSKRLSGSLYPGTVATAVIMDRRAGVIRFPHNQRGGSTHGWKAKMTSGPANAYRIVRDRDMAYGLDDPSDSYGRSTILFAQKADAKFFSEITPPLWSKTGMDLGLKDSYTAMLKAGDHLYLGGGKRDGSAGFIQVVSAKDGSLVDTIELPAQVSPCGLAAAHGQLFVSCLDGNMVALGK
jgi:outer membrane protein assembly factor BamB